MYDSGCLHECQLFIFRLRSSQNVALIQYRIPRNSQGFIFRVSYETNDDRKYCSSTRERWCSETLCIHNTFIFQFSACNILMLEDERLFTMSNDGQARNCTVTSVFTPPNLKLIHFQIGTHEDSNSGLMSPVSFHTFVALSNISWIINRG